MAGTWTDKETYLREGGRIGSILTEKMKLQLLRVIVEEGDAETKELSGAAVVKMKGTGGILKNGESNLSQAGVVCPQSRRLCQQV